MSAQERGLEMSNDKVVATYHGRCQCPDLCGRHPLIDPVDRFRDESTGEQAFAKITEDDPYKSRLLAEDQREKDLALIAAQERLRMGGSLTAEAERLFADSFPKPDPAGGSHLPQPVRRPLSPGEIGLALGIVGFIILLFLFIALTYRW